MTQTKKLIGGYMSRRVSTTDDDVSSVMANYIYHLLMNRGTSEYGLIVLFSRGMQAHLPLGAIDKLGNPECPVRFSVVMGESDWMRYCEDDYGKVCVDAQLKEKGSNFYICERAGHNMHFDNPKGLSDIIINDLLN